MVIKDHMYDSPILDLKFHTSIATLGGGGGGGGGSAGQRVISSDRHIIKVRPCGVC